MTIHLVPRCGAVLLCFGVSACSTPEPLTDTAGAQSVRATLASQVIHPQALRNADPVAGIDGAAALQAQKKYEKSFDTKAADAPLVQRR